MRRRFALVAALALSVLLAAAGCTEKSGGSSGGGGGSQTISVVMAQYSDQTPGYWKDLVSRFEKQNSDIKVNLKVIDWNTLLQQVPTMIQTRSYPDVLNFNAYAEYAKAGLLNKATDVVSPDLQSDFVDSFTQSDSINGTQYAIPWIASVRALGYNKAIFSKIGAQPPTTWQELETVAKKAKAAGYTGYCLPLGSEEAQGEWSMWMWSNGGGWKTGNQWTINSAKNMQALQFLRKLANVDKVTEPNPGKTNRSDGCWSQFAQGKVAMTAIMPLGTFQTSFMKGSKVKWGSSPFPTNNGAPQFTLGVQDVLMSFKKPGHTDAVKKFLSFVYQKDNYLKFIRNEGFLPTTKSASAEMQSDPIAGPGIALLPKAQFYPVADPAWNKVAKATQSELGTAMDPSADPKKVLDDLQQVAQQG